MRASVTVSHCSGTGKGQGKGGLKWDRGRAGSRGGSQELWTVPALLRWEGVCWWHQAGTAPVPAPVSILLDPLPEVPGAGVSQVLEEVRETQQQPLLLAWSFSCQKLLQPAAGKAVSKGEAQGSSGQGQVLMFFQEQTGWPDPHGPPAH